jgi:hypothetical protein
MSKLEEKNIPLMGCMFEDISAPLYEEHQKSVSAWIVKTAMVMDSVKGRGETKRFYQRADCVNMRLRQTIPLRTNVWIGHYSLSGLGAFGTDLQIISPVDNSQLALGMAVTIVVGHIALQVLSTRIDEGHTEEEVSRLQVKSGDWDNMLTQIWPVQRVSVMWPPRVSFAHSGLRSIATLMARWKIGIRVDELR